ncbi:1657_t:CDS:1, partial [Paraglomus brasilianum]
NQTYGRYGKTTKSVTSSAKKEEKLLGTGVFIFGILNKARASMARGGPEYKIIV